MRHSPRRPRPRPTCTAAMLVLLAAAAMAGDSSELPKGDATQTFDERSPLGLEKEQKARLRWAVPPYEISEESFHLARPRLPDDASPPGLLVWISPFEKGVAPGQWREVLTRRRLIWIGANASGNERFAAIRTGLALDGLHNLKKRIDLDPDRIYIAGFSGGGRCASRLALHYPDAFSGGIFFMGCDYFRPLPFPDQPRMTTRAFARPHEKFLRMAKKQRRYVLVTGESDLNRSHVRQAFQLGFKKDRFACVAYQEIPGIGHDYPDGEGFEKAVAALDSPLEEAAEKTLEKARAAQAEGRSEEARALRRQALPHVFDQEARARLLASVHDPGGVEKQD